MPDDSTYAGRLGLDVAIPLPVTPAPCWRCHAPSTRQGLRYDPCEACKGLLAEIVALHHPGTREEGGLSGLSSAQAC
jgi:hypothetical protein